MRRPPPDLIYTLLDKTSRSVGDSADDQRERRFDAAGDSMRIVAKVVMVTMLVSLAIGQGTEAASLKTGTAVLVARTTKGVEVKATVRTGQYSKTPPFSHSLTWWGAPEKGQPRTVIVALDIQIGPEQVPIPVSAIVGLANPTEVLLRRGEGDIEIVIKGGDAATSYDAVLVFKDGYLRQRRVVLAEFPKESWEETNYSYNLSER
jgi:hypothetical protein